MNHWENLFHDAQDGYLAAKKRIEDRILGGSYMGVKDQTNGHDEVDPTPETQHYVSQLQEEQQNLMVLYQNTQEAFLTPPNARLLRTQTRT